MKDLLQDNYKIDDKNYISLKEMLDNLQMKSKLTVPLGKENNKYHGIDFKDIPCLLVTGETGSGKSVFLDCIIISLILSNTPQDINFIMIDPKKIELKYYEELPHTKSDIISDIKESNNILKYINLTYEKRKEKLNGKNIEKYNEEEKNSNLPHLFVIIDESNDLMKVPGNLELLRKITNDCDKVGIHFIIATNNPYENSFDKEWIDSIKYKVTFDLTSTTEANWISIRNSQNRSTPGEAIAKSVPQSKKIKIKTPYISDEDILKIINEYK